MTLSAPPLHYVTLHKPVEGSDLRWVTVLPRAEWLRIQGSLNRRDIQIENLKEAARQREEMHLRSKEVVKFWPHTFGGRTKKKLENKKIREAIEKEEEKKMDIEEAKYREDMRKEAIMKTKAKLFYQTERGKEFHSALRLTEVLKEREAQIQLKQRKLEALKDVEREAIFNIQQKAKEASKQELEKSVQRKRECLAVAEVLKQQVKEREMARERVRQQKQREAEETERQKNLFLLNETMKKQKNLEEKKQIIRDNMAHMSDRAIIRAIEGQQQEVEDKRRQMFVDVGEKMLQLRKEKEAEMFREVQIYRDRIAEALDTQRKKLGPNEDEILARAVAEQERKLEAQQKEKAEKKATILNAIASHREAMRTDKELRARERHQEDMNILCANREECRMFLEEQHVKARMAKEDGRVLQSHHIQQMAQKQARKQLLKKEEDHLENMNARLVTVEEQQFQQYAQQVMDAAAQAHRNILPLRKVAREGLGGRQGPVISGLRSSYLVQDKSGVQMPKKRLNKTGDKPKKRLGFTF